MAAVPEAAKPEAEAPTAAAEAQVGERAPEPSNTRALRAHVSRTRMVTVQDADGSAWTFLLRPAPLDAWDVGDDGPWLSAARAKGPDEFAAAIARAISSPSMAQRRSVLLASVAEPELSADRSHPSAVPVDDLMARYVLSFNLYAEAARLSCESLPLTLSVKEVPNGTADARS